MKKDNFFENLWFSDFRNIFQNSMDLKILHSSVGECIGSSTVFNSTELSTAMISETFETQVKEIEFFGMNFEVKIRHALNVRPFESFCSGLIIKILNNFVCLDAAKFRSFSITVYTNTKNLSIICNSILVAILDAGVPLRKMFSCVGDTNLYVCSEEKIVFSHLQNIQSLMAESDIIENSKYIDEHVKYAFKDFFEYV